MPELLPVELRPFPRSADESSAERLGDGLWRLVIPLAYSRSGTVNCYLIEQADGWCLIDSATALDPGWDALERALSRAGVGLDALTSLVCTHAHPDHYGLAANVVDAAGCELAMAPGRRAVSDIMRDPIVPLDERRALAVREGLPPELLAASVLPPSDDTHFERRAPDRLLAEGDLIASVAGAWEVVPLPGHAPTQIGLFHRGRRALISADLVVPGRIPYLEYGYTPDPWAEQVESLRRADALAPERLLPGHGDPDADPAATLRSAAVAIEAAPQRILAALAGGGARSVYDVVLDVVGAGALYYVRLMAVAGAVCILERLEARGEVVSETGDDGVRRFSTAGLEG